MTATAETSESERGGCWCCGREYAEEQLVRLGDHPEVALCFDCARVVHRRARQQADVGRRGPGARARHGVEALRSRVVARGWHQRRRLGSLLRRLDRFLP